MSLSTELLSQARHLASNEPRRPRQASIRRSISTAYYALFHFLGEESARFLVGGGPANKPLRDLGRRAIAHAKLKDVCTEFEKPTPRSSLLKPFWDTANRHDPHRIVGDSDLATICRALRDLQELRHVADYDFARDFLRQEATDACDRSQEAMDAWARLRVAKPEVVKLFATTILLWAGLSGRA